VDEMFLSNRKQQVLKAIIDAHIAYGEPVGSKFLAQSQQLRCSSATIRNEMAELEALGYLEQPHTSAGRVPSELGYRFYVDALLSRYEMAAQEVAQINAALLRKLNELDQMLAEASRLASHLTNYPAIAAKTKPETAFISRFDGVYVDAYQFVLVMLFTGGTVKTRTLHLSRPLSPATLTRLLAALNDLFTHKSVHLITLPLILELESRAGEAAPLVNPLVKLIYETMKGLDEGDLRVEGVNRLLQYPEYNDTAELRSMLSLLEEKEDLLNLLSGEPPSDDIHVLIGSENTVKVMNNSALVYKTVRRGDHVIGAIGIIGPRRMDYAKVIGTVNHLAQDIDRLLGGDEPNRRQERTTDQDD